MNTKKFFVLLGKILGIFVIIFSVILIKFFFFGNDSFKAIPVSTTDSLSSEEKVNFLVMGTDYSGFNSDVIMLISLNTKENKINLLSIPRDTKVKIGNNSQRINAAYAIGQNELAVKTVKNLLNTQIHHYATVNLQAFKDIIDSLGKVTFDVPQDMKKDDDVQDLHINLKKGVQALNGDQALQLVRFRDYPDADLGRNKVQQDFLKELFDQKMKLKYLPKINKVYRIASKNTKTDLTPAMITKYITLAKSIPSENFKSYELPGSSSVIGGAWYYIHNSAETAKLIKENF